MGKYNFSDRERFEMTGLIDYSALQSLPQIWETTSQLFPDVVALLDPHAKPRVSLTYAQLYAQIQQFAAGIQALGLESDAKAPIPSRVALFADNSARWMIADQGIMLAGAANAVRSSAAEREELLYILEHSGSTGLVVENLKTLKKLTPELFDLPVQWVVLLSDETPEIIMGLKPINFWQLMKMASNYTLKPVNQNPQTLATLIYTSGTTGKPKGVMLTHENFIHQLIALTSAIQPSVGDRTLSILPTWHSFGRIGEYFTLAQGCTQIYTNRRYLKQDLQTYTPQYVVGVPRLWESIYEGIQGSFRDKSPRMQKFIQSFLTVSQSYIKAVRTWKRLDLENLNPSQSQLVQAWVKTIALAPLHYLGEMLIYKKIQQATGGKLKQLICGGGSLAQHLEDFFEIIGIDILVGYGLTETAPVLTVRRYWRNLRGSSGFPIANTQIKIVDLETHQPLPTGQRGLVMARGPQVMQGYFLNPEATKKAIDPEGWFDTGDIGWLTPDGQIVLTGRAKDTIVLTNGENIEPQPIEDACLRSPLIDQIMLVGQDRKSLGAIIVVNLEALEQWIKKNDKAQLKAGEINLNSKEIRDLFRAELNREVRNRPGYRRDDEIIAFELIKEPFTIENGMLTQTLKIRRNVVAERYRDLINWMFA
ncbi:AMP-binding protein [Microseira sp. BLCC-F43]|jgi:long-chain acyl-CoA synthetase|uniref:AMP-binding protein n=1 Tax=Microseira sp. BLCC-F43 TaxID=3153602 RepID=UPI0035BAD707